MPATGPVSTGDEIEGAWLNVDAEGDFATAAAADT
jgi:hypothetical protein